MIRRIRTKLEFMDLPDGSQVLLSYKKAVWLGEVNRTKTGEFDFLDLSGFLEKNPENSYVSGRVIKFRRGKLAINGKLCNAHLLELED